MRTDTIYWFRWVIRLGEAYRAALTMARAEELYEAQSRALEFQLHYSPVDGYNLSQGRLP